MPRLRITGQAAADTAERFAGLARRLTKSRSGATVTDDVVRDDPDESN